MKNPQTILIIGGTGTLGQVTVKRLQSSGHNLRILTRTPDKFLTLEAPNSRLIEGDLTVVASLVKACVGVDTVVVMAHAMMGSGRNASEKVDLEGHRSLIDCAKDAGVKRMIYLSVLHAKEDSKIDFWRTKYTIEQYLQHSGINYTIIQSAPFMETHVHRLLGEGIMKRGMAIILGKGENPTNFVSVADIASFIGIALENTRADNRVIRFGGPENISRNEIAYLYGRLANKKVRFFHLSRGFLVLVSKLLNPFHPGIARIMLVSAITDESDQTFTPSPEQKEFDVPLTSINEFVQCQVNLLASPAGQATSRA